MISTGLKFCLAQATTHDIIAVSFKPSIMKLHPQKKRNEISKNGCLKDDFFHVQIVFILACFPCAILLLMEEILHQLICSLSPLFTRFIYPRWCRISSINSSSLLVRLPSAHPQQIPMLFLLPQRMPCGWWLCRQGPKDKVLEMPTASPLWIVRTSNKENGC